MKGLTTVCVVGLIITFEFEKLISLEWSKTYILDIWLIALAIIADKLNKE